MIKSSYAVSMFCFIQSFLFAQKQMRFKIEANFSNIGEIYVTNTNTNSKTIVNKDGFFEIVVLENHVLVFSGEKINKRTITIKVDFLKQEFVSINVYSKTKVLDEVVIKNEPKLNTVNLGVVSKDIKSYTPAERKLRTAGKFKWYSPLLIPFGGMSVDGIINQISGRTKMLKKELLVEKQEQNQKKLLNFFTENYFLETLKIPQKDLTGFLIFSVQDQYIINGIAKKSINDLRFRLIELAVMYKSNIVSE